MYSRLKSNIKQKFLERQHQEEVLDEQIKKLNRIERKGLFTNKGSSQKKKEFHYQQHATGHSLLYLNL